MISSLDLWLSHVNNFNLFVGIVIFIGISSMAAYTYFLNKIGKKDEYSLQIRLGVTNKMFISLVILFMMFIFVVPSGLVYYKQLIALCISITALVGAISAAYYYVRDFKG